MTASSSVKPKAKFSSRNVNAVYRAPALRDSDYGGGSSGYRTGGVNGLNRLLVLRGPVRSGAMGVAEANAVAAPTPINTPSLRKEHMGQDIHVTLVPAGKSGGWGGEGSEEGGPKDNQQTKEKSEAQEEELHSHDHESAWDDGAPPALMGHARPRLNTVASLISTASTSSGRWGDDAVEEDLAQVEYQRDMVRRKEFPDLHEQLASSASFLHDRRQCRDRYEALAHSRMESDWRHSREPMYSSRPSSRNGYDDRGYNATNRPLSADGRDERGYRGHHVSLQDARYGSPVRNDQYYRYERYHNEMHQDFRRVSPYDARRDDGPVDRSYGSQNFNRYQYHEEIHRREHPRMVDNQYEHSAIAHPVSAWKVPPNLASNGATPPNVWKMSEAEVTGNPKRDLLNGSAPNPSSSWSRTVERTASPDVTPPAVSSGAVRILRREAPRMLFDHKSGTMIEVENTQSNRRSRTSSTSQPSEVTKPKSSGEQQSTVTEIPKNKLHTASSDDETDSPHEKQEVSLIASSQVSAVETASSDDAKISVTEDPATSTLPPSNSDVKQNELSSKHVPMEGVTTRAVAQGEPLADDNKSMSPLFAPTQAKISNSKVKDTATKRVSMRGKMKRVVVAYRPVEKSDTVAKKNEGVRTVRTVETSPPMHSQGEHLSVSHVNEGIHVGEHKSKTDAKVVCATSRRTRAMPLKSALNDIKRGRPNAITKSSTSTTEQRAFRDSKRLSPATASSNIDSTDGTEKFIIHPDTTHSVVGQPVQEISDDGGEAFTTVKSRRTILLERKKQREQLAAALSGFHERGDVKRPSGRVTLPASIARFGKKGLLVGFKQKPTTLAVPVPVPLPVLEKSFIDVIRPPVAIQPTTVQGESSSPTTVEISITQNTARQNVEIAQKLCADQVEAEAAEGETADAKKEKKMSNRRKREAMTIEREISHAVTMPLLKRRSEKPIQPKKREESSRTSAAVKRRSRGSMVNVVQIYVPKPASTPVTEGTLEPSSVPATLSRTKAVAKDDSVLDHPTAPPVENERSSSIIETSSPVATQASISTTSTAAPRSAVPHSSAVDRHGKSIEPFSSKHTRGTRKVWMKAKTESEPHPPLDHEPHSQCKRSVDKHNRLRDHKSHDESAKPEKANPKMAVTKPVETQRKVSRRTSHPKALKTNTSASTQKMYKQVYVVKATSTATSPSAA